MPFGLTNVPAVFQAMINDLLRDFIDQFVYVYLDNILIYSSDLDSHRTTPHLSSSAVLLVSRGRGSLSEPQAPLRYSSHSHHARSPTAVRGGGGRLQQGDRGRLIPAFGKGWKDAPLRLPVVTTIEGRADL